MNRLLQSIAVWYGIGMALVQVGLTFHDRLYWCIMVLMLIMCHLERKQGREDGILLNGLAVINMKDQIDELESKLREYESEKNT